MSLLAGASPPPTVNSWPLVLAHCHTSAPLFGCPYLLGHRCRPPTLLVRGPCRSFHLRLDPGGEQREELPPLPTMLPGCISHAVIPEASAGWVEVSRGSYCSHFLHVQGHWSSWHEGLDRTWKPQAKASCGPQPAPPLGGEAFPPSVVLGRPSVQMGKLRHRGTGMLGGRCSQHGGPTFLDQRRKCRRAQPRSWSVIAEPLRLCPGRPAP